MKDLFVLTADADAQALLRQVLLRSSALSIRSISCEVRRLAGRDSGMVKEGPELARMMVNKTEYSKLLLVWDHHGSGWERDKPEQAIQKIQGRLDGTTWTDRSSAVVVVPELEEWLWHSPTDLARHVGLRTIDFDALRARLTIQRNWSTARCLSEAPKELFETLIYQHEHRKPTLGDFERLGRSANLRAWANSQTFSRLLTTLRSWFPA